jgi:hypothetical protein
MLCKRLSPLFHPDHRSRVVNNALCKIGMDKEAFPAVIDTLVV